MMKLKSIQPLGHDSYVVSFFSGNKISEVLLFSPLDIQAHIMVLPAIRQEHIESTIRIKLRSLYPGNSTDLETDYQLLPSSNGVFSKNGGKVIVFCTDKQQLELYRAANKPLLSVFTLLVSFLKRNASSNQIGVLMATEWIAMILYVNDELQLCVSVKNTSDIVLNQLLLDIFRLESLADVQISIIQLQDALHHSNDESFYPKNSQIIQFSSLFGSLSVPDYMAGGVFSRKRKSQSGIHKKIIGLLVVINILCLSILLEARISQADEAVSSLKIKYEKNQKNSNEIQRIKKEMLVLSKQNDGKYTNIYIEPYSIISTLVHNMKNLTIKTLTINGSSFQFTAEGTDSLNVMAILNESDGFKNIVLNQSVIAQNGKENFSISGELSNDNK